MLGHTPLGLGHPYRYEPDQRIPTLPIAGEPWKVCAMSDTSVRHVYLYIQRKGTTELFELISLGIARSHTHGPYGETAKATNTNTHLTDLMSKAEEFPGKIEWEIEMPILDNFEGVIYWLESDTGEHTALFPVNALVWRADDGQFLHFGGNLPAEVIATGKKVLKNFSGEVFRIRFELPLAVTDHVVGFGERFHSIDQRGEFVDAVVFEEYKGQGHRTYLPTPFGMIIGSDYGLYIRTANPSRYDIGATEPCRLLIEVDISPSQSQLEIVTYTGSPIAILRQYMSEFTLPKPPPSWIYKLWGSSNEWNTQARVEREIEESIFHGIEIGVVVIEAWSDESTFTAFRDAQFTPNDGSKGLGPAAITYPRDGAWPDPKKMISGLHERNIKVLLWQIPVIKEEGVIGSQINAIWNYGIQNDLVVKDSAGKPYKVKSAWFHDALLPDLTDFNVRQWWAGLHDYLVTDLDVDGFKTDGGEHAWGSDLRYVDGRSGLEKNNYFAVAYAQTFNDLLISANKEGVTFSRAGFAGSSSYSTFWAGDEDSNWDAFKASVRAGITASACGIFFWGWDIGGFSGEIPTSELYLRGAAMAAFCPIMQFHSEFNHHREPSNDRTPWNIERQTGDTRVISIFRKFANIRTLLIPYLENEAQEAIKSGRPLMAGLFFDFAQDQEIWKAPYQYLLGRYLLVAPVVEPGVTTWKIYLPEGTWIDFWSKSKFIGKSWIDFEVPIDCIPIFIKMGAPTWMLNQLWSGSI